MTLHFSVDMLPTSMLNSNVTYGQHNNKHATWRNVALIVVADHELQAT